MLFICWGGMFTTVFKVNNDGSTRVSGGGLPWDAGNEHGQLWPDSWLGATQLCDSSRGRCTNWA